MFGGAGVFVDGLMIALISDDVIYLKADAETIPAFEREGLGPFSYATKDGEHTLDSYWRMPDRLYDDPRSWRAGRAPHTRRRCAPVYANGSPRDGRAECSTRECVYCAAMILRKDMRDRNYAIARPGPGHVEQCGRT